MGTNVQKTSQNAQKTGIFAYPTTPFGAFMSIVNRIKNSLISIAYAIFGLVLMVVLILLWELSACFVG